MSHTIAVYIPTASPWATSGIDGENAEAPVPLHNAPVSAVAAGRAYRAHACIQSYIPDPIMISISCVRRRCIRRIARICS
jgi:hypothetical protein